MTHRLYYENAFDTRFSARVVAATTEAGKPRVALDRTLFYPEGGGQPPDYGRLTAMGRDLAVIDVQADGEGRIWHTLALQEGEFLPEPGSPVEGEIDWQRRHDHMQQHTGEHIIANCLHRLTGGFTHGLHIGQEV